MKFLSEIMHGYSGLDVRGEMFSKNIYILGDIAPVSSWQPIKLMPPT